MSHPERFRRKTRLYQTTGEFDIRQFVIANALAVLVAQLTVALLLE